MELTGGPKFDEKSCGIVVFREDKGERLFLLLHYPGGHWDLVKGHVEKGEDEQETATRELLEETGIADLQYVFDFREGIEYTYLKEGEPSRKQVIFFLGKTECADIHLSHEHHEFIWLPYEKALERLTFDNAKGILKKAQQKLQNQL